MRCFYTPALVPALLCKQILPQCGPNDPFPLAKEVASYAPSPCCALTPSHHSPCNKEGEKGVQETLWLSPLTCWPVTNHQEESLSVPPCVFCVFCLLHLKTECCFIAIILASNWTCLTHFLYWWQRGHYQHQTSSSSSFWSGPTVKSTATCWVSPPTSLPAGLPNVINRNLWVLSGLFQADYFHLCFSCSLCFDNA